MNSRYWGKTVIKLLNFTSSVYNFSNNGNWTENSGIKTSPLAREHVSTQGTLAREHVFSAQGTQFSRIYFYLFSTNKLHMIIEFLNI